MNILKILPSSLHVVFARPRSEEVKDHLNLHMIASTYFVNKPHEISYEYLQDCLSMMGINTFFILYIMDTTQEDINFGHEPHTFRSNKVLFEVDYIAKKNYIPMINSDSFNFDEMNKYCLYIFVDMSWFELAVMFKSANVDVIISGGSTSKRHLISPLQLRLSSYIIALFDMDSIEANNYNNFRNISKERYLPFVDFSNKSVINVTDNGVKKSYSVADYKPSPIYSKSNVEVEGAVGL